MRYFVFIFFVTALFGANSKLCKTCHPTIYNEFKDSMHYKSTLKRDSIHKALWDKTPQKKENSYLCAKCHNPKIDNKVDDGVDCISCHTIKNIKEGSLSNSNIYCKDKKLFYSKDINQKGKVLKYHKKSYLFGLFSTTQGSPYHDIDYSNKNYYNAKACMGCHSHLKNSSNLLICNNSNMKSTNNKQNCITCHMPKVIGSATTIKITKKHAYHGFLGAFNKPKLLAKYIDLKVLKENNSIKVLITNNTPHPLFTQPLRVLRLKVDILEKDKVVFSKNYDFKKVFAKDNKVSMPLIANKIIEDSMIKANETKNINIEYKLKKGQIAVATLGFFKIADKSAKKLGIKDKNLSSFIELKKVRIQN
jgi:hypothetical protein